MKNKNPCALAMTALMLILTLLLFGGCSDDSSDSSEPIRTSGTNTVNFDAGIDVLSQSGPRTLSKATQDVVVFKTLKDYSSYLWILDDAEIKGTEPELTLKASNLEKGNHKLVLIITKEGVPYSSPEITITVKD